MSIDGLAPARVAQVPDGRRARRPRQVSRGRVLLANIVTGLAFGIIIASIGFADYAELNRMFTFRDPRMLLAFGGAVAIIMVVFALLKVRRTPGRVHAGVVPGAVLFGTGWAISGGCPAIPIVQVASGYLPALATIAGVLAGIRACQWANGRYFHLDGGTCGR